MSTHGIQHTEYAALYMRKLLAAQLCRGETVEIPDLPLDYLEKLHFTVKVVQQAVQNQSMWKVTGL